MTTIVTALRGLHRKTVYKLYYDTTTTSYSIDDWIKKVNALSFNIPSLYLETAKELEVTALLFCNKCNVTNYIRMKYALTNYLYDKFVVPNDPSIIVEPIPTIEECLSENEF